MQDSGQQVGNQRQAKLTHGMPPATGWLHAWHQRSYRWRHASWSTARMLNWVMREEWTLVHDCDAIAALKDKPMS